MSSTTDPGFAVILNVYDICAPHDPDLIPNVNSWTSMAGLGVFHSGIEILGREYCFGGHPEPSTGVFEIAPRQAPDAKFRQAIHIGNCQLDQQSLQRVLNSFTDTWAGNSYSLLSRNCNHFADELSVALTGMRTPGWVNRLAFIGERFKGFLPEGFDTPMAAPVTAAAAAEQATVTRAPSGPPLTPEQRRAAAERAAVAAEVRAAARAAKVDIDDFDDPDHDFVSVVQRDNAGRAETS